jgi:hypothetical protein
MRVLVSCAEISSCCEEALLTDGVAAGPYVRLSSFLTKLQ